MLSKKSGLLSGGAVYLFSNILNSAIPFLLLPILTRILTPSEYGEVAMFQTLVAFLAAIVGLNTVGAANRKYFDNKSESDISKYIGACLYAMVISLILVMSLLLLFQNPISEFVGIPVPWLVLAVLASSTLFIVKLRLGQWQVRKQSIKYGLMQIGMSLLNAVMSIIFVVYMLLGPEGRVMGIFIAYCTVSIVAMILLAYDELLSFSWDSKSFKDALSFGVPLIPHVGGIFFLSAVDRFIVNDELGLDAVGIYMVAVQLAMILNICFDAFNKAYVPWLYERLNKNNANEKVSIVKWTYIYFLVAILMSGVAFLIGPFLVVLIAGGEYSEAGSIIGFLALGQSFHGMYLMVTNYIFYSKNTGALAITTIISGTFNIVLLLLLVPILGLQGAAFSFALAMGVRFFATWYVANKSYPMPWLRVKLRSGF